MPLNPSHRRLPHLTLCSGSSSVTDGLDPLAKMLVSYLLGCCYWRIEKSAVRSQSAGICVWVWYSEINARISRHWHATGQYLENWAHVKQ